MPADAQDLILAALSRVETKLDSYSNRISTLEGSNIRFFENIWPTSQDILKSQEARLNAIEKIAFTEAKAAELEKRIDLLEQERAGQVKLSDARFAEASSRQTFFIGLGSIVGPLFVALILHFVFKVG